jgi:hypothetical protein
MHRAIRKIIPIFLICFNIVFFVFHGGPLYSQSFNYSEKLKWAPVEKIKMSKEDSFGLVSFAGSITLPSEYGKLPVFTKRFPLTDGPKNQMSD